MTSTVTRERSSLESRLESRVAEEYRTKGFEVLVEPQRTELPFDLGSYRPDLVARKQPDEGYIIEVRSSVAQTPIDRYREIADIVAGHAGWHFLLVTGDDVASSAESQHGDGLLTWEQIAQRTNHADRLISLGEAEPAYLSLWGTFEAILRRHADTAAIPIQRLPTSSLVNHLYSQGELSMEQYSKAQQLLGIRNRVVHGYQTPDLFQPTTELQGLVSELTTAWH